MEPSVSPIRKPPSLVGLDAKRIHSSTLSPFDKTAALHPSIDRPGTALRIGGVVMEPGSSELPTLTRPSSRIGA